MIRPSLPALFIEDPAHEDEPRILDAARMLAMVRCRTLSCRVAAILSCCWPIFPDNRRRRRRSCLETRLSIRERGMSRQAADADVGNASPYFGQDSHGLVTPRSCGRVVIGEIKLSGLSLNRVELRGLGSG